jgi:hypothetical protein
MTDSEEKHWRIEKNITLGAIWAVILGFITIAIWLIRLDNRVANVEQFRVEFVERANIARMQREEMDRRLIVVEQNITFIRDTLIEIKKQVTSTP